MPILTVQRARRWLVSHPQALRHVIFDLYAGNQSLACYKSKKLDPKDKPIYFVGINRKTLSGIRLKAKGEREGRG